MVLFAGCALASVVGLILGLVARATQAAIDERLYDSFAHLFTSTGWWPALAAFYTQLGDQTPMMIETALATVVFAILFRKRWWIPILLLPVGFAAQLTIQKGLEHIVARGHPFTGAGTFPSGGSARFVVIYGIVAFLILLRWPRLRRFWPAAVAVVVFLAALEGYTRLYLLMHWPTDVVGGWVVGGLLLAALIASAVAALEGEAMEASGRAVARRLTARRDGARSIANRRRPNGTVG